MVELAIIIIVIIMIITAAGAGAALVLRFRSKRRKRKRANALADLRALELAATARPNTTTSDVHDRGGGLLEIGPGRGLLKLGEPHGRGERQPEMQPVVRRVTKRLAGPVIDVAPGPGSECDAEVAGATPQVVDYDVPPPVPDRVREDDVGEWCS